VKFPQKNIIIVGMTGVGKTTIGRVLSKETGINFIDIDQEIEKITNLKIRDFFKIYGENEFRKLSSGQYFYSINISGGKTLSKSFIVR